MLSFFLLNTFPSFSIEGNQLETREENKYWLTRHLEMCRQIFLQDFRIITVKIIFIMKLKIENVLFSIENMRSLLSKTIRYCQSIS